MAIEDYPLNLCRGCGELWLADPQKYEETDRCPHCGRYLADSGPDTGGTDDVEG